MNRFAVMLVAFVFFVMFTAPAHAQGVPIKLVFLTWMVQADTDATVSIQTAPGAACRIMVRDMFGSGGAPGLAPKTADTTGLVSWMWHVPDGTIPRPYPISVNCSAGGQLGALEATIITRVDHDCYHP